MPRPHPAPRGGGHNAGSGDTRRPATHVSLHTTMGGPGHHGRRTTNERTTAMPDADAETRACPFCKEEVKTAAIRCKHCLSDIPPTTPDHGGVCPFCKEA